MANRPDSESELIRLNLKRFREGMGLTTEELADEANIPIDTLRRLENGRRSSVPDVRDLRRLAVPLGRTLDEFFQENPSPSQPTERPVYYIKVRRGAAYNEAIHRELVRVIQQANDAERKNPMPTPPPTSPRRGAAGARKKSVRRARK
jgi:transcriptional regulator with XRE-family HTH domain